MMIAMLCCIAVLGDGVLTSVEGCVYACNEHIRPTGQHAS